MQSGNFNVRDAYFGGSVRVLTNAIQNFLDKCASSVMLHLHGRRRNFFASFLFWFGCPLFPDDAPESMYSIISQFLHIQVATPYGAV